MDFIVDNYMWFILGAVVILMTVVGYLAEKTDFASKKHNKDNKENGSSPANGEPQIAMPDNTGIQTPNENNMVQQNVPLSDQINMNQNVAMPTVDGVPSELFAPVSSPDVVNIDSSTLGANLDQVVEPVNLTTDNSIKIDDADGLNFDSLYEPVAPVEPTEAPVENNIEVQSENMEGADAQVSTIEEEPSSDPLFAVNTIPLSQEEEEKPPVDPWAEDEVETVVEEVPTVDVAPTEINSMEQPVEEVPNMEMPVVEEVPTVDVAPTEVNPMEQPVEEVPNMEMPVVEEVPTVDVVPTEINPMEQPVEEVPNMEISVVEEVPPVDQTNIDNVEQITPQPLLNLQLEQGQSVNDVQLNSIENVEGSNDVEGGDVWQF